MEIPIPEGCALKSVHLTTDSQEVYDRIVRETEAYEYGADTVSTEHMPGDEPDKTYKRSTAYWRPGEDSPNFTLDGPKRYVTVTVADV